LGFSSPSIAFHHLEKLQELHVVGKDEYGRYYLSQKIEVGILQVFIRVGRFMLPRFTFYATFFTSLLIIYVSLYASALNVFALAFALAATIMAWYETLRAWKRRPF
jgi:hypothetical protein